MSVLRTIEKNLDTVFTRQLPPLPPNGQRALVQYLPWINLLLGFMTLYAAYALWHWAHLANNLVNLANNLSALYGGPVVTSNRLTFGIWLGIAVLIAEGLLYLAAYPGTRDRKKSGWNLMFYALLVNAVYAVIILFTDYGSLGSLIWTLIGTALGLYLIFQVHGSYAPAKGASSAKIAKRAKAKTTKTAKAKKP